MIIMPYTFVPKEKHAKAYGNNMRISAKHAAKICRVIRNKPLTRVKRLLNDLVGGKRSLGQKYYTKTAEEMLSLIESCEKNAEFLGLDKGRLMVRASAHLGTMLKRRRRKAKFGSKMKATNLEIMLIESGRKKAGIIRVAGKKDAEKAAKKIAEKVKSLKKEEGIQEKPADDK